jgi:hypothetical protein
LVASRLPARSRIVARDPGRPDTSGDSALTDADDTR